MGIVIKNWFRNWKIDGFDCFNKEKIKKLVNNMKVYEEKWSAKTRDHLIWCIKMMQKEIDQDIVIKMFDHLKGRVHMANQNGLQSLQKSWKELILPKVFKEPALILFK